MITTSGRLSQDSPSSIDRLDLMKSCPNCDEELDVTMIAAGVCDHCGEVFEERKDDEAEDEPDDDKEDDDDDDDEDDEEED